MGDSDTYALCLRCRDVGHGQSACRRSDVAGRDPFQEGNTLKSLRSGSNVLCGRCAAYNILDVFDSQDVIDFSKHLKYIDTVKHVSNVMNGWMDEQRQRHLVLGRYNSIKLNGTCPLCRLVFRIFPAEVDHTGGNEIYYIRPLLSYDRQSSYLKETSKELKEQYSLYFSVECEDNALQSVTNFFADPDGQMVNRVQLAFGLSSENQAIGRSALRARKTGSLVDFSLCRTWLERCRTEHGTSCRQTWTDELLAFKMIDVHARKVVACPKNCSYVALSYVWGNIKPATGALESRTLPQTIEDAISVTTNLGLRYLWVDALCIDQTPAAQKAKQIAMMDDIYQCATVTIVAVSGDNSAAGLPGVSQRFPRFLQGEETINGKRILTVFPMLLQDVEKSKYQSRAWTMQESLLTRCRLIFTKHQVHWWCNSATWSECVDETDDPANYTDCYRPSRQGLRSGNLAQTSQHYNHDERLNIGEEDYRECVENYTSRQLTNDFDSLNAFLGVVGYLRKAWIPNGFVWGLPLRDFPQSLRWFHPRQVKPRRRSGFPSWSWCGWEGTATYSGSLDLLKTRGHSYVPVGSPDARVSMATDMTVKYAGIDGQVLTVEGYQITLDIRTEPFSEAFAIETGVSLGPVRERNFLHNNTLATGRYEFLVVERFKYRTAEDRPLREEVYMILLEGNGEIRKRRTKVRISLDFGRTFEEARPRFGRVKLL